MTAVVQRSFSSGEISPALYARTDVSKYASALRTCRNFQVMRHGGAANRAGTQFIGEVKNSLKRGRLLKFVFNSEQTYVLEFGDLYIRFYRNGGQILVSGVTAWSAATNYVVGDLASRLGVNYYCILAHINQQPPNATYWYPLTGDIYEIPTPYLEADLMALRYVQSGDVITIVHPSYIPRELSRTGHTAWTLAQITFAPSIATPSGLSITAPGAGALVWRYKVTAVMDESYEESLPSAVASDTGDVPSVTVPITLTWTATTGAIEYNVYRETFHGSGTYGFIGIAGSNSFSDPNIVPDGSITPPIARNPFDAINTYPQAVGYYQQRQIFGGSNLEPEKTHASRSGNFKNFTISSPTQDDDALSWTIAAAKVQSVKHIISLTKLIIFTAEGEWAILGGPDGVLRPGEINPGLQSENGSGELPPIVINKSAVYAQARGSIVRDLNYSLEEDGYLGDDLTVFATHLFQFNNLDDWDFQKTPNSIIWAARDDGVLLGLTYLREHKVLGWHRHDTKGGFFENVCTIPEGDEDGVYFIVNRVIGGQIKRYIERMASRNFRDIIDAYFVDSGLSYDGWNAGAQTQRADRSGTYLSLPGTTDNYASTPDSATVSITGDIDIRVKVAFNDWTPTGFVPRTVNKYTETGNQRAYMLRLLETGDLQLVWSNDGIADLVATSTALPIVSDGNVLWIRSTLDVDNGAAGRDIKFYTSTDGVIWAQLGATVTQAGITSIFDSTSLLYIGNGGAGGDPLGKFYYAEVRNGIDGPVVAKFDPERAEENSTSIISSTGETWTVNQSGSPAASIVSTDTWLHTQTVKIKSSVGYFVAGDVGNTIVLYSYIDADGLESATVQDSVEFMITEFISTTLVSARPNKTVPIWARNVAGTDWSKGVDELAGFNHLIGETISIFADGHVETPQVVPGTGIVTLPHPRSLIFGGLPITADLETLDIDTADGAPLTDKYKNVQAVDMVVESSRGIFVGPDEDHLEEFKQRELEDMGEPVSPLTGSLTVNIESNWNSNGRVLVRQVDPLPLTILSIVPSGMIPLGED